jgi:ppGpp synthetase/RelA/SpoT-type nucleotidyltranferase
MQSFVRSEGARVIVAQRLKRVPTIAAKLVRLPTQRLTQMQDIGGCRAILPTQDKVYDVVRRIRRRSWDIRDVIDYAATPKSTGYRAVHIVVNRRGRFIEIQLRTPSQQAWAAEVDRAAGQVGVALKDGAGPPDVTETFRDLAERMAQMGDAAAAIALLDQERDAIRQQVRDEAAAN